MFDVKLQYRFATKSKFAQIFDVKHDTISQQALSK